MEPLSKHTDFTSSRLHIPEILNFQAKKFTPLTTVFDAQQQLLTLQLQTVLTYKPIALEGIDPEGIHKVRVGLRRLRTALNLFKPYIEPDNYKFLQFEARSLANKLGNLRDLDVIQIHFANYAKQLPDYDHLQKSWNSLYKHHYSTTSKAALSHLNSDEFDKLLTTILHLPESPGVIASSKLDKQNFPTTLQEFLPAAIGKKITKVRSYREKISPSAEYHIFHKLRLNIKKLRYSLEFFSDILNHKIKQKILNDLVEIQDKLGNLNDAHTANTILNTLKASASSKEAWINDYQQYRKEEFDNLKNEFLIFWEDFYQEKLIKLNEKDLLG